MTLFVLLWTAEPFLSLTDPKPSSSFHGTCATCHMKDACGEVCCCVPPTRCDRPSAGAVPGYYAPGCRPDKANLKFFPTSLVKWLPSRAKFRLPRPATDFFEAQAALPAFPSFSVPTPPPEKVFLS